MVDDLKEGVDRPGVSCEGDDITGIRGEYLEDVKLERKGRER